MTRVFVRLLALCLAATSAGASAQSMDEIIVTAAKRDESARLPGAYLRRTGDFMLLEVTVTNDTREFAARKREIYDTLKAMLAAANRDGGIELSVIDENDLVLPLRVDDATVSLAPDSRPDTSRTSINVKTRIPASGANSLALIAKLKQFVASIKPSGRTQLLSAGSVEISIVNPLQYREQVIELFATDAARVTKSLGEDYRVIVRGIDQPIRWIRMGVLDLALFVPYQYDVIPATVNSYSVISADD
ncbi:MAG: hypothetical protein R3E77_02590 [Steroidobacteraceae bacterium]